MNIFQIPKKEDESSLNVKVIGIIDSSGSMSSYWKYLATQWNQFMCNVDVEAFCFDDRIHPVDGFKLNDSIHSHGGGMTDIYKAFDHFEKLLDEIPKEQPIVVIFISDGGHNVGKNIQNLLPKLNGTNRKLNFLCLGVGKSFPTYISMTLREKYHTGDASLPAIFLIEYITEEAFRLKFESMQPFYSFNQERKISPAVTIFPWLEKQEKVYENSWILTDQPKVTIDDEEIEVEEFNLNLKGIQEIFRSWGQQIYIDQIKNKNHDQKSKAKNCLNLMDKILENLKKEKNIDLLQDANFDMTTIDQKMSFKERSWKNYLRRNYERTSWYYKDMKDLAEGTAQVNNEFDAAKKIMVGTVVGNYKKKIQGLQNINSQKFTQMKNDFKEIYKKLKLEKQDNEDPFSQRSIFVQKDFLKGLDNCKNIFDLLESFPVIGVPCKINIGSYIINDIFNTQEVVNSTLIVHNNGAYVIKKDKTISVNCVIPYLEKEDEKCAELFKTELFQSLITFQVFKDADRIDDKSLIKLLKIGLLKAQEKDDDFHKSVATRFTNTIDLLYPDKSVLVESVKNANYGQDPEALADINLVGDKLDKHNIEKILDNLIYNIIKENQPVTKYFDVKKLQKENQHQKLDVKEEIKSLYKSFKTRGQFERKFKELTMKQYQSEDLEIVPDLENLKKLSNQYASMQQIIQIANKNQIEISDQKFIKIASGIYLGKSFQEIQQQDAEKLIEQVNNKIISKIKSQNKQKDFFKKLFGNHKFQQDQKNSYQEFQEYFKKIHKFILPISQKEFQELKIENSENKKIAPNYNQESNLSSNVCLCKDCGFYGKVMNRLSHHFDMFGKYPRGFHIFVKNNLKLSDDEILKKFIEVNKIQEGIQERYGYTQEEFLEYVKILKEKYSEILK